MSTTLAPTPDARAAAASPTARPGVPPDSTPAALDAVVARLAAQADAWFALPAREKLRYVRAAIAGTRQAAADQVRAACAAKGHPFDGPLAAEDWFGGPVAQLRGLRLLARTLERVAAGGPAAAMPREVRTLPDGRLAVDVFPADWRDRVLFAGVRAEVWLAPGVTRGALAAQVAALYGPDPRAHGLTPGVAAVLGAGNVAAIGPLDVVHKLFAEGQVAVLKFNPVNAYLGPFFEAAFADLVRDGYVATAYGGADVGARLTAHPGVASVHVTGSRATHDAIVWGTGEEAARRRAEGRPKLAKPITSELGNVTPVIVVPGAWSERDLRMQAEHVATQMAQNAGFNCIAAKVVVVHDAWPQRGAFLDALRAVLRALPGRPAYYPGAAERWARFTAAHPGHEALGDAGRRPARPDAPARPRSERPLGARLPRGVVLRGHRRGRPSGTRRGRLPRPRRAVRERHARRDPRRLRARRPGGRAGARAGARTGDRRPALRHGRRERVAGDGLRPRRDALGRVPRAHARRRGQRHRHRARPAAPRPHREERRAGPVPGAHAAARVRHPPAVAPGGRGAGRRRGGGRGGRAAARGAGGALAAAPARGRRPPHAPRVTAPR
jgi:hypothetical protein